LIISGDLLVFSSVQLMALGTAQLLKLVFAMGLYHL
jgi:hypothetical protein